MKKTARLAALVLVFSLAMSLFGFTAWAAGDVTVYVTVISNLEGSPETVLDQVPVKLNAESATVMEAVKEAAEGDVVVETGDWGAFITGILGVSDDSGLFSWTFTVNGEMPWFGAEECEVAEGDEILFSFINWQEMDWGDFDGDSTESENAEIVEIDIANIDWESLIPRMMVAPVSFDVDTMDFYMMGQLVPLALPPFFDYDLDELFIPLRTLTEALGMDVEWEPDTAHITIIYMGMYLEFFATDNLYGMPAKIVNDRLYIPSVFLIEAMMAGVFF
jgi:hypothetical protein